MGYTTLTFLCIFLPAVMLLYHVVRAVVPGNGVAKVLLLAANLVFYAWTAADYLPLILILALITYLMALVIAQLSGTAKKVALAFVVSINAGLLVFYKYFGLALVYVPILQEMGYSPLLQPLGISFLVFSLISYVVDVYRGHIPADKNVLNVLVWATFFPKMVSGPIVRYEDMSGALDAKPQVTVGDVSYGARRFVMGLAKKVLIANYFGTIVDKVFLTQTYEPNTPLAWLGIIGFTFQLYFDFAGYSDMAIGIARMMGFQFKENFNYPYISTSITEFWRRWHISLSSWLRDYLYIPLGGSRTGNVYLNLLIVFVISGLWHGSGFVFFLWGLWHGLFMVLEKFIKNHTPQFKLPAAVGWAYTMLVIVVGWVFFRSSGIDQALLYLQNLVGLNTVEFVSRTVWYYLTPEFFTYLVAAILLSTPVIKQLSQQYEENVAFEVVRSVGIVALFVLCLIFVENATFSPFLYEQF